MAQSHWRRIHVALAAPLALAACLELRFETWKSCDADPDCGDGFSCVDGLCTPCPPCSAGEVCVQAGCLPLACGDKPCHLGQVCIFSECSDPRCLDIRCASSELCAGGACYPRSCPGQPCPADSVCVDGACRPTSCVGVACASGEVCADGRCLPPTCPGLTCAAGTACENGRCVPIACVGIACPLDTLCAEQRCLGRDCGPVVCQTGTVCLAGACVDPGCVGATCPSGTVCTDGACPACAASETSCGDGRDEDCDGLTDCDDPDCLGLACGAALPCGTQVCDAAGACVPTPGSAGIECRPSAGPCDLAEQCDGAQTSCPTDQFIAPGTECRAAAGPCDLAETCTGTAAACPTDLFATGTQCRPGTAPCDAPELCDGSGAACPPEATAMTASCPASASFPVAGLDPINWDLIYAQLNPPVLEANRARWQVTPTGLQIPAGLSFWAELDGATGTLTLYLDGWIQDVLRAFLPHFASFGSDANLDPALTPDGRNFSHVYTPAETLLTATLDEALASLVALGAVGPAARAGEVYRYGSSQLSRVRVLHKYIAATEYGSWQNPWAFHDWLGDGNDPCRSDPAFFGCSYANGTQERRYALTYTNPSSAFLLGACYNDNSESTRVLVDGATWLEEIDWGRAERGASFGPTSTPPLPTELGLTVNKTWSGGVASVWYAVAADAVTATGPVPLEVDATIDVGTTYMRPRLRLPQSGLTFSPASPRAGDTVTVTATVVNDGEFQPLDPIVYFHVDRVPVAQKVIGSARFIAILSHSSAQISKTWTAVEGTHLLRVIDGFNSGDGASYGYGGTALPITVAAAAAPTPYTNLAWSAGFDTDPPGSFSSGWVADANAVSDPADNGVDNTQSMAGNRSLKLYGSLSGSWSAVAYHTLGVSAPLEVEVAIRVGTETGNGNPHRAAFALSAGMGVSYARRYFYSILLTAEGASGGGTLRVPPGTFTNTWHTVRVRYELPNATDVVLSTWFDGAYQGSETLPQIAEEASLSTLMLDTGSGSAWYDSFQVLQP